MKKIVFFLLLFLCAKGIIAQDMYQVDLELRFISNDKHMECDTWAKVIVYDTEGKPLFEKNFNVPGEKNKNVEYKTTYSYPVPRQVGSIKCEGHHRDNPDGPKSCYEHCSGSTGGTIYDSEYPCVNKRFNKFFGKDDGGTYINIKVTPILPFLTYSANGLEGISSLILPDTKKIKISTIPGYHRSVYQWKYSIDGVSSGNIPQSCKISDNEIEICGFDLIPNFQDIFYKNPVKIYLDCGCGTPRSDNPVLTPTPCVPEILSARGIDVACENGVKSGRFEVELSRALYPGEQITFTTHPQGSQDSYADNYFGLSYIRINPDNPRKLTFPYFDNTGTEKSYTIPKGTYRVDVAAYFQGTEKGEFADKSGAFSFSNIVINEAEPVGFNGNPKTTAIVCPGSNDGTITVNTRGGNGTYIVRLTGKDGFEYTSEPFQGQKLIQGLKAGDYDLSLSDTGGCDQATAIVTIEDTQIIFNIASLETEQATLDEDLREEQNGSIRIQVYSSPDLSPYHYVWMNPAGAVLKDEQNGNTSTLSGINSGTYQVNITNSKGCSINETIVLNKAPEISIKIAQTADIICSGNNTGELTASVSGGTSPYTYKWYQIDEYNETVSSIGGNSPVLSGIPAGAYRLEVTDANGYKIRSRIVYQTEKNPILASFTTQNLDCYNSSDGFLEINVSGGTPPYTYHWDNSGNTTNRIENLWSGDYGVTVTDSAGCFKHFIGTITSPGRINVNATTNNPSCAGKYNGSIYLQISGGNAPYSISWSNGYSNQTSIVGLSAGEYSVTVTDAKGCEEYRTTYTLQDPDPIVITPGNNQPVTGSGMKDGKFSFYISGGNPPYSITCLNGNFRYSADPRNDGSVLVTFSNLPEGNYEISVKSQNQPDPDCSTAYQATITTPPPIWVTIMETRPITCYGGSDGMLTAFGEGGEVDAPGAYNYQWFSIKENKKTPIGTNSDYLSNLPAGTYSVTITDKNGISASADYRLIAPLKLELTFDVNKVSCPGGEDGSISAMVKGGEKDYTYLWDTGETTATITGKKVGKYSVTVTDERKCQITGSAEILNPDSMTIQYSIDSLTCYGSNNGAVYLEITGGTMPYSFLWSDGTTDQFIKGMPLGSYSVTITDAKGCSRDTTFFIPEPDSITVQLLELKQPIGFGYTDGSISVEINGGTVPYTVVWRDSSGVALTTDTLVYSSETDTLGNSIHKAVSTLRDIGEGFYDLEIRDAHYDIATEYAIDSCGCFQDSLSFYLPQPPKLIVSIEKLHDVLCYGSNEGIISSTAEGGVPFEEGLPYLYHWERDDASYADSITELQGIPVGVYRLVITDKNGITAVSNEVTVLQPDSLVLKFTASEIQCGRDTTGWAEVAVTGGVAPYTYDWSNGATAPRIEHLGRGKHMVRVHDSNGCEVIGFAEIIQTNAIRIEAVLTQPTCFGGSDGKIEISLSKGEPPYTYHWRNGPESLTYTGLKKGSYTFIVNDKYGCGYDEVTYELDEPEEVTVDLGEDRELCAGQTHTIKAKVPENVSSLTWYGQNGKVLSTGDTCTLSEPGTYTVHAVTGKGCEGYGKVTITRDNREIAADFLAASKIPIGEEVYMVNISIPEPDQTEWILPQDSDNYEVLTKDGEVLGILFKDYGIYTVGMKTYSGNCWKTVMKTVQVMDKIDIENYESADEPMLKVFTVAPNPAKGRFFVSVELKKSAPVELYLIDSGTGKIIERRYLSGNSLYNEVFDLAGIRKRIVVVALSASETKAVKKVILQ